jgi:hypothetical protein
MFLTRRLSPRMRLWQREAYREIGVELDRVDHQAALFPKNLCQRIDQMDHTKVYDICFIGAYQVDERTAKRRRWLIDYVKRNFTARSYLQFTDTRTKESYVPLGPFDFTLLRAGFVPKEVPIVERNFFDEHYYQIMCQSQFTVCPGGDRAWSIRFYEALMCKSIPILRSRVHHRSLRDALRGYKTYTAKDPLVYRQDWVDHNYHLFLKHHTLASLAHLEDSRVARAGGESARDR